MRGRSQGTCVRDEKKRRESGSEDSARRPRVPFPGPGQGWRFPRLTGPPSPCPQLQQAPGLYSALAPWPAPTCHLPDTHMRSTYNKTQVACGRWQVAGEGALERGPLSPPLTQLLSWNVEKARDPETELEVCLVARIPPTRRCRWAYRLLLRALWSQKANHKMLRQGDFPSYASPGLSLYAYAISPSSLSSQPWRAWSHSHKIRW